MDSCWKHSWIEKRHSSRPPSRLSSVPGIVVYSLSLTIESLFANTHPCFEVVVVDQSTNDDTRNALAAFQTDPRLVYVPSQTTGLGRARNIGLAHVRAECVAMTDDDCEVPTDWVAKMERYLVEHPSVAVAYCDVEAAAYDQSLGFTPIYHCQGEVLLSGFKGRCNGIGAGMAVRKSAVQALGGFDEMLGAGALFPSFSRTPTSPCAPSSKAIRSINPMKSPSCTMGFATGRACAV